MKNIIIHGCTFGSNFGDCLFAKLFYDECEKINPGCNLFYNNKFIFKNEWFAFSKHYEEYLNYNKKCNFIDVLKCKGIVFMGGGYFGETTKSYKEALIRYYRYLKLGLYARIFHKPVVIIGVEAGPISVPFLKRSIKKLFNYATIVTVRNEDSYNFLKGIGVKNEITITADPAISIDRIKINESFLKMDEIIKKINNKKIILFHLVTSTNYLNQVKDKIIPSLNAFLENNKEYGIVLTFDQITSNEKNKELKEIANLLNSENIYVYSYANPSDLVSLINYSNYVITTKLHVGIVSCALKKSVISFPFNSNKILRFYKYIGEENRCQPIENVSKEKVLDMINFYTDKTINISKDIKDKAEENYILLDKFLKTLK